MNLLAHLFLTRHASQERMVGNFIADRVKGKKYLEHPPEVARGILLHRSIDSYTDAHSLMMECKQFLHPYHGKWAGVVIDVLNDHFLATEWERYSPEEELEDFVERMQRILMKAKRLMSDRDRWILERMVEERWLVRYRDHEGLERAFQGLGKRTGASGIENAVETLQELETALRKRFIAFFPELIQAVKNDPIDEKDEIGPPPDRP